MRVLTGYTCRDDAAGRLHLGMHGLLQLLAQTARLPSQQRFRRDTLRLRVSPKKCEILLGHWNSQRGHAGIMLRAQESANPTNARLHKPPSMATHSSQPQIKTARNGISLYRPT